MDLNNRALVLTPNQVDAELASSFLRQSGIEAVAFIHAHEANAKKEIHKGFIKLIATPVPAYE